MTYRHTRWPRIVAACAALTLVAACGTSGRRRRRLRRRAASRAPDLPALEEVGDGEGEVNILAWPGYVEDGSTDPAVDWVTPFEQETGCEVNVKYLRYLRRGRQPGQDRGVRRGVGVGRRVPAADRRR